MRDLKPQAALEEAVCCVPDVEWSIKVIDIVDHTVVFSVAPGRILKTASLAKVMLLLEVAARFEDGTLDEEELVDRSSVARVEDSGLWRHLRVKELPLIDAAVLVAAVSDNWATNVLLHRVGLDAVQARSRTLGYPESRLEDYVRDVRGPDVPPTISLGRARDWVDILARMHRRQLVSVAVDSRVEGWLGGSVDLSMVAAPFRLDPLVHEAKSGGLNVHNKTGTDEGVRADAGLIIGNRSLAYCAIANWTPELDRVDAVLDGMNAIGWFLRRWAHATPPSPDPAEGKRHPPVQ